MSGSAKPLRKKNPIQKIEKSVKIEVKLPHIFSIYVKSRAKRFHAAKTTRFFAPVSVSAWPKSSLHFDFKNHEIVWIDLKQNIAGQVLTYNSTKNHWLHNKLDLKGTRSKFWKQFSKNQIKKISKNSMSECYMWKKKQ